MLAMTSTTASIVDPPSRRNLPSAAPTHVNAALIPGTIATAMEVVRQRLAVRQCHMAGSCRAITIKASLPTASPPTTMSGHVAEYHQANTHNP